MSNTDAGKNPRKRKSRKALRSCFAMATGLCFHFFGYECARAASIALLADKENGLGNEALPLTIAIGTPLSGLTLYLYTKSIKKYGSSVTLRISMFGCTILLALISVYSMIYSDAWTGAASKWLIILFYAFREIYVSLLSTQQWAFIASNLDTSTSSYLVSFTGLVSIASAVGGCVVEHLVNLGGVRFLLLSSFIANVVTFFCSEVAYCLLGNNLTSSYSYGMLKNIQSYSSLNKLLSSSVSDKTLSGSSQHLSSGSLSVNGADSKTSTVQTDGIKMEQSAIRDKNNCRIVVENDHATHKDVHTSTNSSSGSIAPRHSQGSPKSPKYPIYKAPSLNLISSLYQAIITYVEKKKTSGFWFESYKLVQKHHLLKLLFVEALTHQCCTNMLNLMFHNSLRKEIEEDSVRAMLVGRFFATVNISACSLQCFVLPHLMSHKSLPQVLLYLPIIVFFSVMLGVFKPGIISVMIGFGTIKVLEYSVMTAASEMIYMPMDHDVRYLGKELIKFFGHKLGKSTASLMLSFCIGALNPSLSSQSLWGAVFSGFWAINMYQLSQYLTKRQHKISGSNQDSIKKGSKDSLNSVDSGEDEQVVLVASEVDLSGKGKIEEVREGAALQEGLRQRRGRTNSNGSAKDSSRTREEEEEDYGTFIDLADSEHGD